MKQRVKQAFTIVHPDAAGIEVSSRIYYIAVPPVRDEIPVRRLGSFTQDFTEIVDWLFKCNITCIAMESTSLKYMAYKSDSNVMNMHYFINPINYNLYPAPQ